LILEKERIREKFRDAEMEGRSSLRKKYRSTSHIQNIVHLRSNELGAGGEKNKDGMENEDKHRRYISSNSRLQVVFG